MDSSRRMLVRDPDLRRFCAAALIMAHFGSRIQY
jgi:hypothetical protein